MAKKILQYYIRGLIKFSQTNTNRFSSNSHAYNNGIPSTQGNENQ